MVLKHEMVNFLHAVSMESAKYESEIDLNDINAKKHKWTALGRGKN